MRKQILRHSIGTPSHIGFLHMKEDDTRRHKSRCVYYLRDNNGCSALHGKCIGSSHCDFYSEQFEKLDKDIRYEMEREAEERARKYIAKQNENKSQDKDIKKKKIPAISFYVVQDYIYPDFESEEQHDNSYLCYVTYNPIDVIHSEKITESLQALKLIKDNKRFISMSEYRAFADKVPIEGINFIFLHEDESFYKKVLASFDKRRKKAERKNRIAEIEKQKKEKEERRKKTVKALETGKRTVFIRKKGTVRVVKLPYYNKLKDCPNCREMLHKKDITFTYATVRCKSIQIMKCPNCGTLYMKITDFLSYANKKKLNLVDYVFTMYNKEVKRVDQNRENPTNTSYKLTFY